MLITGASGFLGKYAVSEFLEHDYEVVASGRNPIALANLEAAQVKTLRCSLNELREVNEPVGAVVHSAALSSIWGKKSDFMNDNVLGTESVVTFCEKNNVQRLVFVSSPSIYSEKRDKLSIKEHDTVSAKSLNYYIESKLKAEALVKEAHQKGRIPELVIVRPRGLIGIGDPSLMPRLMHANNTTGIPLFNDGTNMVDVTCVENVASALRLSVESKDADGGVFNITNDEPQEFKQLIESFFTELGEIPHFKRANATALFAAATLLEKLFSIRPNMPEPPITRYTIATLAFSQTLDITAAKEQIGYKPRITLQEGIQNYVGHIKEQREQTHIL